MPLTKQTHCKNGHEFTDDNVYVATHKSDGHVYRQCRTCHRASQQARRDAMTPEERAERRRSFPSTAKMRLYQRKYRFEKRYGITVEAAKELLIEQDGFCAICYGEEPATDLDHDHVTGEVRGWLCHRHNLGIGYMDDDADTLVSAADYVRGVA